MPMECHDVFSALIAGCIIFFLAFNVIFPAIEADRSYKRMYPFGEVYDSDQLIRAARDQSMHAPMIRDDVVTSAMMRIYGNVVTNRDIEIKGRVCTYALHGERRAFGSVVYEDTEFYVSEIQEIAERLKSTGLVLDLAHPNLICFTTQHTNRTLA